MMPLLDLYTAEFMAMHDSYDDNEFAVFDRIGK